VVILLDNSIAVCGSLVNQQPVAGVLPVHKEVDQQRNLLKRLIRLSGRWGGSEDEEKRQTAKTDISRLPDGGVW
jgi:hypothetical protein